MRISALVTGLSLVACGPTARPMDATDGTPGTTSGDVPAGTTSVTTTSSASSEVDPSGASSTGAVDPTTGELPSDSSDDPGTFDCPCSIGEMQACDLDGWPGIQECLYAGDPHFCYWSECWVPCRVDDDCREGEVCVSLICEPTPTIATCDRQSLTLSTLEFQGSIAHLTLADLDGDGKLDLVVARDQTAAVEVALGDGAGGFSAGILYSTGLDIGNKSIAVADFNGDGSPDIAVAEQWKTNNLSLLAGKAGVFAAPLVTPMLDAPGTLAAGDFDGDQHPDLLDIGGFEGAELVLYRGDGKGGFSAVAHDLPGVSYFTGSTGALAGQPQRDVATSRSGIPGVDVLEYKPGIGFSKALTLDGAGVSLYDQVVIADIDGDAAPDVVAHRTPPGTQQIQTWPQLALGASFWANGPIHASGDVDGDGREDLLLDHPTLSGLGVVYVDAPCVQPAVLPDYPRAVVTDDLDGDGKADIVVGNMTVYVLRTGP